MWLHYLCSRQKERKKMTMNDSAHQFLIRCFGLLIICLLACGSMQGQTITFTRDTLVLNEDSVLIITTACAPVCSSVVVVEDHNGKRIGQIRPPFEQSVFPEAYIEEKHLRWRDNTPVDEEM